MAHRTAWLVLFLAWSSGPARAFPQATKAVDRPSVAELTRQLKSASEDERCEALEALAKLDGDASWSLIIKALDDASARVADVAALHLSGVDNDKSAARLFSHEGIKSGKVMTRRRVAEAFGRMSDYADPNQMLISLAEEKDSETRRILAWSFQRRANLGRLRFEDFAGVSAEKQRTRLFQTLAAMACSEGKDVSERTALLFACQADSANLGMLSAKLILDEKGAPARAAVLAAVQEWASDDRVKIAKRFIDDPDLEVRTLAVELLAGSGSKTAIESLLERLSKEPNLRLRWRIVARFQVLSSQALGLDPEAWRPWVEGLAAQWAPAVPDPRPPLIEGEAAASHLLLGTPVPSERIAILIDASAPLWVKRADGTTRRERLAAELQAFLARRGAGTKFNLIPFGKSPTPWRKSVAPASPDNVARALEFLAKLQPSDKSDLWEALELAWSDQEVDTLLVLTGSEPSGGKRWSLWAMGHLLTERNRSRRLSIDAFLFDNAKLLRERWAAICTPSWGRLEVVSLD